MVRILELSEDEYYVPSSCLLLHILRWIVMAVEERLGKTQWYFDMKDTVRVSIVSQYTGKGDIDDSD